MPKAAVAIECSTEVLRELEKLSRGMVTEKRLAERANIILHCLEGESNETVSQKLKIKRQTVVKWRSRFAKRGLSGLRDADRTGKPKRYGTDLRGSILKTLEQSPPKGQSTWDGISLAKVLNVSDDAVWRVLRKEGIQLQRCRSWCVSTDKEFAAKSADIVGLYLNPPENALVICVDEKPSIQALERARGYVETSSGKIVQGLKSTYKRHGTLNLFAALHVATGKVITETTKQKKRPDFQAFLDKVIAGVSTDSEIHIILDNYCTHKKNDSWLSKHPNVFFHYTPTSASWLNQVEIWFGIFTRKALRGASFCSEEDLRKAIEEYVKAYHEGAKPFVWRKREVKGAQLRNTIVNLRE